MAIPAAHCQASEFDRIKAAAAKEGHLVVWHNTPKQDTTDELVKMFNKRFGMNITVERVPVSGGRMTSRIMSEKRGGKFTVDVFIATDRHLPRLVKNGLVEKVDWVKTFAGPGRSTRSCCRTRPTTSFPNSSATGWNSATACSALPTTPSC